MMESNHNERPFLDPMTLSLGTNDFAA
jgi:hypothetical protein